MTKCNDSLIELLIRARHILRVENLLDKWPENVKQIDAAIAAMGMRVAAQSYVSLPGIFGALDQARKLGLIKTMGEACSDTDQSRGPLPNSTSPAQSSEISVSLDDCRKKFEEWATISGNCLIGGGFDEEQWEAWMAAWYRARKPVSVDLAARALKVRMEDMLKIGEIKASDCIWWSEFKTLAKAVLEAAGVRYE